MTDPQVSRATLDKFRNNFWYLAPETVALEFFVSEVSLVEKRKLAQRLRFEKPTVHLV